MTHRSLRVVAALALLGASLSPMAAFADGEVAPLQSFETWLTIDGTPYGCVIDPSSWREPNAEHNALVDQGYTTSLWIATHMGPAPFADQIFFLCRVVSLPS